MSSLPHYPSVDKIEKEAKKAFDAAVKTRGEYELHYIPLDIPEDRRFAGRSNRVHQDLNNPRTGMNYAVDSNGNYRGTEADWAALRSEYAWIRDPFERRVDSDPAEFQPIIDSLERAALALHDDGKHLSSSPIAQYVSDASGALSSWTSGGAQAFKRNYLNRIKSAAKNQAFIVGALYNAIVAERDVFVKVRQDLFNLAKNTTTAIEASTNDKDSGDVAEALGVVAAATGLITTIAGLPVAGLVLMPEEGMLLKVITGFTTVGSKIPAPKKDHAPTSLGAYTVDGVLSNMTDVFGRIDKWIDTHETNVAESLDSCRDTMTGKSRNQILLPPPGMVNDSDAKLLSDFVAK